MQHEPQQDRVAAEVPIDWTAVWKRHGRWVLTVLVARVGDPHIAEDLLQELALSISRNPGSWPDSDRIAPWLYRAAIRQVQMHRRRTKQTKNQIHPIGETDVEIIDSEMNPLEWMLAGETKQQLNVALEKLAPQDREMLMLKHGLNWSYRQLSEELGVSQDKIIYRLGRARRRLRAAMVAVGLLIGE